MECLHTTCRPILYIHVSYLYGYYRVWSVATLHVHFHVQIHIYIHIHIHITECIHTVYLYPCLYLYGYYREWSVSTLHVHSYSISMSVSIWILWNVECSYTPHTLSFHIHIDIMEFVYTVYLYPCLYLYGYYGVWSVSTLHVDSYSMSMFVSIWILWNVECSYTPCTLSFHIHIYICIHIDITECVYTVYLYPCLYLYGYYGVWSVSTHHIDQHSIVHVRIHLYLYGMWSVATLQCGLSIHIHIYIYNHIDIMECVYTLISISMSCNYIGITECGVSPHFM